jgi:NTE family protein
VLFSPVSLRNYGGRCGHELPDWVRSDLGTLGDPRRRQRADLLASYLSAEERPYIHLVDGGLSDNLGLRAILDEVVFAGGIQRAFERQRLGATDHILFVVVNAQSGLNAAMDKLEGGPIAAQVIDAATTVQINRYNFETVELLRNSFLEWGRDLRAARCNGAVTGDTSQDCDEVQLHLAEINFESIPDAAVRDKLRLMPTSFALPRESVDQLRTTARELLRSSAGLREFLRATAAAQ